MGLARLGDVTFRVNPSSLVLPFSMDTSVQQTVGGRVVQVYGATFGDLVIGGLFGQQRGRGMLGAGSTDPGTSWRLAEDFVRKVRGLVNKQRDLNPHRFTFTYDLGGGRGGRRVAPEPHSWDLDVYIKDLKDADGNAVVEHSTGKFSHGYTLTLFVVRDRTDTLISAAADSFITRLAEGVGWEQSAYNGALTPAEVQRFLASQSPGDPTIQGWLRKEFGRAVGLEGETTTPTPSNVDPDADDGGRGGV